MRRMAIQPVSPRSVQPTSPRSRASSSVTTVIAQSESSSPRPYAYDLSVTSGPHVHACRTALPGASHGKQKRSATTSGRAACTPHVWRW